MYQEDIEFIHSHQEFVELKKTIDQLQKESQDKNKKIQEQSSELDEIKIHENLKDLFELDQDHEDKVRAISLEKRNLELKEQLEKNEIQRQQKMQEYEEMSMVFDQLKTQVTSLEQAIEHDQVNNKAKDENHERKIDLKRLELIYSEEKFEAARDEVEALSELNYFNKVQIEQLRSELSQLTYDMGMQRILIQNLTQQNTILQKELDTQYQTKIDQKDNKIQLLEAKVINLETQMIQELLVPFMQSFQCEFEKNQTMKLTSRVTFGINEQMLIKLSLICLRIKPLLLQIEIKNNQSLSIEFVKVLSTMTCLQSLQLRLSNNQLSSLKPLSDLKSLSNLTNLTLGLGSNQVSDLKHLASLKYLGKLTNLCLSLGDNQISDLRPLADLKQLQNLTCLILELYSNEISDLMPLMGIGFLLKLSILTLDLGNNIITDLKPLSNLRNLNNLQTLNLELYDNKISDVKPLEDLYSLVNITTLSVELYGNNINVNALTNYDAMSQLRQNICI